MEIDLRGVFFHGTRNAHIASLRPSSGGEFGPGIYLTSFEPTAQFYAKRVARGPDSPTVLRVRTNVSHPFEVTKSRWVKMTERSSPSTVQRRLRAKGYDSIVGIANNGYEWQLIVFDPANVTLVPAEAHETPASAAESGYDAAMSAPATAASAPIPLTVTVLADATEPVGSREAEEEDPGDCGCRTVKDPAGLTVAQVQAQLRPLGIVLRKKDAYGDFRVNYRGGSDSTAYHTPDLDDALATGLAMARRAGGEAMTPASEATAPAPIPAGLHEAAEAHAGPRWVPPAMAAGGLTPVMLETLLGIAGWPNAHVPSAGTSVVYDRDGYGPLSQQGYIVLRRGTAGTASFADRYVLTDKGAEAIRQYRLHARAIGGGEATVAAPIPAGIHEASKKTERHDLEFAGYKFTSGPSGTIIDRQQINTSASGDYGADPLGDGMFRMVPSGDIVDFDERNRRLARFDRPRRGGEASEYEGWKNRETWTVNLWANNDPAIYRLIVDHPEAFIAHSAMALARRHLPRSGEVAFLGQPEAWAKIDWNEIAKEWNVKRTDVRNSNMGLNEAPLPPPPDPTGHWALVQRMMDVYVRERGLGQYVHNSALPTGKLAADGSGVWSFYTRRGPTMRQYPKREPPMRHEVDDSTLRRVYAQRGLSEAGEAGGASESIVAEATEYGVSWQQRRDGVWMAQGTGGVYYMFPTPSGMYQTIWMSDTGANQQDLGMHTFASGAQAVSRYVPDVGRMRQIAPERAAEVAGAGGATELRWERSGGGTGWRGEGRAGTYLLRHVLGKTTGTDDTGWWNLHVSGRQYGPYPSLDEAKRAAAHMDKLAVNEAGESMEAQDPDPARLRALDRAWTALSQAHIYANVLRRAVSLPGEFRYDAYVEGSNTPVAIVNVHPDRTTVHIAGQQTQHFTGGFAGEAAAPSAQAQAPSGTDYDVSYYDPKIKQWRSKTVMLSAAPGDVHREAARVLGMDPGAIVVVPRSYLAGAGELAARADWDIHIVDPKTRKVRTERLNVPGTDASMGDTNAAAYAASKKFKVDQRYILALPHRDRSLVNVGEAREQAPYVEPGQVCRPWVRMEKDPQAFNACMALAEKLGPIEGHDRLYEIVRQQMQREDVECFYSVVLDTHLHLRAMSEISRGGRDRVPTPMPDLARMAAYQAIHYGGMALGVAHTHPSGKPRPSEADKQVTEAVERLCDALGIMYVDHLVIGATGHGYYSFRKKKIFKPRA